MTGALPSHLGNGLKETIMFAVIFTVRPGLGKTNDYLGLAGYLKPMLEKIEV